MVIPCFIAKAESNVVKDRSEEPGMECMGGPVVFPHLLARKIKQKTPSNTVLFSIIRMTCQNCCYRLIDRYLFYKLLGLAPSVKFCVSWWTQMRTAGSTADQKTILCCLFLLRNGLLTGTRYNLDARPQFKVACMFSRYYHYCLNSMRPKICS